MNKTVILVFLRKTFDSCTYSYYFASPNLSVSSETQSNTDTQLKDGKLERRH